MKGRHLLHLHADLLHFQIALGGFLEACRDDHFRVGASLPDEWLPSLHEVAQSLSMVVEPVAFHDMSYYRIRQHCLELGFEAYGQGFGGFALVANLPEVIRDQTLWAEIEDMAQDLATHYPTRIFCPFAFDPGRVEWMSTLVRQHDEGDTFESL